MNPREASPSPHEALLKPSYVRQLSARSISRTEAAVMFTAVSSVASKKLQVAIVKCKPPECPHQQRSLVVNLRVIPAEYYAATKADD